LLIGGYAVNYYGYSRATADMDIWIGISSNNAEKVVEAIREFGYDVPELRAELFLKENQVVRMGVPPFRIEVITSISGVSFDECYAECTTDSLDEVKVNLISLRHPKVNKKASGRNKDLVDLEYLP